MNNIKRFWLVLAFLSIAGLICAQNAPQQAPKPETAPTLTATEQIALKAVGAELEPINQDFQKEHPGWALNFNVNIVPSTPKQQPQVKQTVPAFDPKHPYPEPKK